MLVRERSVAAMSCNFGSGYGLSSALLLVVLCPNFAVCVRSIVINHCVLIVMISSAVLVVLLILGPSLGGAGCDGLYKSASA